MKTTIEQFREVAEIGLTYNPKVKASDRPGITNSSDAAKLFKDNWDEIEIRESFKVMYLNRGSKVLGIRRVSEGGLVGTVIDIRQILGIALKCGATAIILCHNHPSGNLQPSEADRKITRKIKQSGEVMDIKALDHLIISSENYLSFADEGWM